MNPLLLYALLHYASKSDDAMDEDDQAFFTDSNVTFIFVTAMIGCVSILALDFCMLFPAISRLLAASP